VSLKSGADSENVSKTANIKRYSPVFKVSTAADVKCFSEVQASVPGHQISWVSD